MSGKKQYKEQADEGMMRACSDLQADMELAAGLVVTIEMRRTKRKGVYALWLSATGNPAVWSACTVERYCTEWPRSEVATLAAAFFQAMHKLDLQVGEAMKTDAWVARDPYPEG